MKYQEFGFISFSEIKGVSEGPMGVLGEVSTK
jgi:hypothetical protein